MASFMHKRAATIPCKIDRDRRAHFARIRTQQDAQPQYTSARARMVALTTLEFAPAHLRYFVKGRVKYRVKAAYVIINFVMNRAGPPRTRTLGLGIVAIAVPHPLCT